MGMHQRRLQCKTLLHGLQQQEALWSHSDSLQSLHERVHICIHLLRAAVCINFPYPALCVVKVNNGHAALKEYLKHKEHLENCCCLGSLPGYLRREHINANSRQVLLARHNNLLIRGEECTLLEQEEFCQAVIQGCI